MTVAEQIEIVGPWCEAHLERKGVQVRSYKMGLCEACFHGAAIELDEKIGGRPCDMVSDEIQN